MDRATRRRVSQLRFRPGSSVDSPRGRIADVDAAVFASAPLRCLCLRDATPHLSALAALPELDRLRGLYLFGEESDWQHEALLAAARRAGLLALRVVCPRGPGRFLHELAGLSRELDALA